MCTTARKLLYITLQRLSPEQQNLLRWVQPVLTGDGTFVNYHWQWSMRRLHLRPLFNQTTYYKRNSTTTSQIIAVEIEQHKIPGGACDRQPDLDPAHLLQCQSSPTPALPTEVKKDSYQPIGLHHFLQSHCRECCIRLQHESSSVSERTALTRLSGSHSHHLGIWQGNAVLHGQKGSWRSSLTWSLAVFPPAFRQKVSQYNVNLPNCHQTGKFIMHIINGYSTIT